MGPGKKSPALVYEKGFPSFLKSSFKTRSEKETLRLAEKLGEKLKPGSVVALTGEIGSGKTVFIKGLSKELGVKDPDEVKSPTFVLLHLYKGRVPIHHFDLYRLEKEKELDSIGFDEFVSSRGAVSLVEWADRAPGRIPKDSLWVQIQITGPTSRKISSKRSLSPPKGTVPFKGDR